MDKITKNYVERIYRGVLFSESTIQEVVDRDPLKIPNDGTMQGFRFFDQDFVVDGEKVYSGEKSNYSPWIYFGERLSAEQIVERYGKDPEHSVLIRNIAINGYTFICHTQVGSFLPMSDGDMTYREVVKQRQAEASAIK